MVAAFGLIFQAMAILILIEHPEEEKFVKRSLWVTYIALLTYTSIFIIRAIIFAHLYAITEPLVLDQNVDRGFGTLFAPFVS